ncbi:MAG: hypothetical protein U1A72_18450 [Sulfuritalea sp.]|nr:hypothetical protein [Sulfuritalea sp.]
MHIAIISALTDKGCDQILRPLRRQNRISFDLEAHDIETGILPNRVIQRAGRQDKDGSQNPGYRFLHWVILRKIIVIYSDRASCSRLA